jgi:ERCC4-related helicase/dsRNA-specific ribonuclease
MERMVCSSLSSCSDKESLQTQEQTKSSSGEEQDYLSFFLNNPVTDEEVRSVEGHVKQMLNRLEMMLDEEAGEQVWQRFLHETEGTFAAEQTDILTNEKSDDDDACSSEKVTPRDYQTALFEIAKQRNTIIHLGTGKGKTLIALLCINHFGSELERHSEDEGHKKQTWFVVPSVALALQQTSTLRANLSYRVETACATAHHTAHRSRLQQAQVLVATHGAIYDLLMHYGDVFSMKNCNFLVLDECHYASGKHHYRLIMDKFYHSLPPSERPRVLALTASPLQNVKPTHNDWQLQEMLGSLESTLDCKLATLKQHDHGSSLLDQQAREIPVTYQRPMNLPSNFPRYNKHEVHEQRPRELEQVRILYQDLGPKAVAEYLHVVLREISRNIYEEESDIQFQSLCKHLNDVVKYCRGQTKSCPSGGRSHKLMKLEEILTKQLANQSAVGLIFCQRRITAMALNSYFGCNYYEHEPPSLAIPSTPLQHRQAEASQFDDAEDERDEAIPFDLKSKTKRPLKDISHHDQFQDADEDVPWDEKKASQLPITDSFVDPHESNYMIAFDDVVESKHIRCGVLVRQPTQIFKYLNLSNHLRDKLLHLEQEWLHQEMRIRETLDALRAREINVLLATSVIEEGVDVQACSFVVCFDSVPSSKAYIQMKGRARRKDANFFLFETNQSDLNLEDLGKSERRLREFIEKLQDTEVSEVTIERAYIPTFASSSLVSELEAAERGEYQAPYGRVDLNSAKSLLNRYVQNIPLEENTRATRQAFQIYMPFYGEYELILPAHLGVDVKLVQLPGQYHHLTKRERQKMLALMACVRLHRRKLLNDRLLPLDQIQLMQEVLNVVKERVAVDIPGIKTYNVASLFASGPRSLYAYPILLRGENRLEEFLRALQCGSKGLILLTFERIAVAETVGQTTIFHPELGEITNEFGGESFVVLDETQWDTCAEFFSVVLGARWRRKSRQEWICVSSKKDNQDLLAPYVVGLLGDNGELDWPAMNKTIMHYNRAFGGRDLVCSFDAGRSPLLVAPIYSPNTIYMIWAPSGFDCSTSFPDTQQNIRSYKDYFRVKYNFELPEDEPLFVAQRLWVQPCDAYDSSQIAEECPFPSEILRKVKTFSGLATVLLPLGACREAAVADPLILLLFVALPQFLYNMERHTILHELIRHCSAHFPRLGHYLRNIPLEDVCKAMTAKAVDPLYNYDKLEWLGDAVLKLLQSDALLHNKEIYSWAQCLHEGELSSLRSSMASNEFLADICQRVHFDKFILSVPLARGMWLPRNLEYFYVDQEDAFSKGPDFRPTGIKVYSDVMESLLGVVFIHFGYYAATEMGLECGLSLPREDGAGDHIHPNVSPRSHLYDAIKRLTGITGFHKEGLVEEAVTHASAIHEQVPSYQRLEWIGDAVLSLSVREWIFRVYPDMLLGDMVTMDAAMVSNEVLGYRCKKIGFHVFINHRDQSLPSRLEHYDWTILQGRRGLWGSDPPKILADVLEAVVGAAHEDGGYEVGQKAARSLMRPIFDAVELLNDPSKLRHPITWLNEMGGGIFQVGIQREDMFVTAHGKDAAIWQNNQWRKGNIDGTDPVASVHSMDMRLLSVGERSLKNARNRACALIVAVLKQDPFLIDRLKKLNSAMQRRIAKQSRDIPAGNAEY